MKPRGQLPSRKRHNQTDTVSTIEGQGPQPQALTNYQVMSIPTIVVLREGQEITRLDGLIRETDLATALGLT